MEGTSAENASFPPPQSVQQNKRVEREEDEEVRVIQEPVKKKAASKRAKGKTIKTEDEEDKGSRWTDEEIEMLIALRGEMEEDFKRNSKKQGIDIWLKLHNRLLSQMPTFKKTTVAIKKKFNSLFKVYKEDKLANNVSGESRHECKYYEQFEKWFSQTGSVHKHVTVSANDVDLPVQDSADEMDVQDSKDSTKRMTSTKTASGKPKFHDEALTLFGKMVETSEGLLKRFNRTTDILNNQMDRLIDKL